MYRKRTPKERFWEILPGGSVWLTFIAAIALSYYQPAWAALFIICFDLYWLFKAINVSVHLVSSYRIFRFVVNIDWYQWLSELGSTENFIKLLEARKEAENKKVGRRFLQKEINKFRKPSSRLNEKMSYREIYHLILIPFVNESFEVLDSTLSALDGSVYEKDRMMVVLATEERAGQVASETANQVLAKYGKRFANVFVTVHPDGLEGEIKGKSSNTAWAVADVLPKLNELGISVPQVLVSNFDSDTIVHPQYFARVTYEFLTSDKPYRKSYQPIAIYNNNIWDSPAFIRVVSVSNSFWQFTESSRPDRLRTFSSHTMTLQALIDVGYWKKDIINEDGYIFWQCYLHYEGDYQVEPLFIPVSLDTCLAETFWQTLKNQYNQKKRWAYNVEYYPHLIPKLLTSKAPFWDRMYKMYQYVEGDFNWAAASVLISMLGLLPLFIGGREFNESVLALNLPQITKFLLTFATVFLLFSVYINLVLLPPRPKKYGISRSIMMYAQWFLVPIVSIVFGSLPAIEAQSRLMLGFYLEFWVTPKSRKGENTALQMKEMQGAKR